MKIDVFGREVEVHQVMAFMKIEELMVSRNSSTGREGATVGIVAFPYIDERGQHGLKNSQRVQYRTSITYNGLDWNPIHSGDFSTSTPALREKADEAYIAVVRNYVENEGWIIRERQSPELQ